MPQAPTSYPLRSLALLRPRRCGGSLNWLTNNNIRSGMTGTVFAVLWHTASSAINICPIGFTKDIKEVMDAGMPWKEWMLNRLNDGIVT